MSSNPRPAARRSVIWKLPLNEFKILVANSKTLTEILAYFGMRNIGHNNLTLKKRLREEGIDYSHIPLGQGAHFKTKRFINRSKKTLEQCMQEIFITNRVGDKKIVRTYIRYYKLIEDKCRHCSLTTEWNGKPLTLQLEHINGDSTDDRVENLCWLCPNCHSQTDTYTGKANRKKPICARLPD